jgi:tRNA/tmRNA/rRNA uracil-C5-methylase (TrmA/RlmC/RlmD family)
MCGSYADRIVLDPPREGAGKEVVQAMVALNPRAIVYIACDPAALARDTTYLSEVGYEITKIRAFDLFPMTHHIETVALFTRVKVS